MVLTVSHSAHPAAYRTGAAALLIATAVILAALAFEHIGGYQPCPLCLQQRYAYYAAIPLLFVGLVMVSIERPRIAALLFFLVALAFLANMLLGTYHAGAEWKLWPGPEGCAGTTGAPATVGNLMENLETETGARCDEPQWRLAGLSFAGWNVVMSLALFVGALKAALLSASRTNSL
jgi:disulfide bond formation protein DsbB